MHTYSIQINLNALSHYQRKLEVRAVQIKLGNQYLENNTPPLNHFYSAPSPPPSHLSPHYCYVLSTASSFPTHTHAGSDHRVRSCTNTIYNTFSGSTPYQRGLNIAGMFLQPRSGAHTHTLSRAGRAYTEQEKTIKTME